MEKMQTQEMISALADGQLRGDAFARSVEMAASDPAARDAWHTYHLIGDVLRTGELAAGSQPHAFLSGVRARLAQERAPAPELARADGAGLRPTVAANDDSFRWKMVAGLASLAAVVAVTWTLVSGQSARPDQAQLAVASPAAAQPATVLASTERGPMIRDPRLDELLAAHRQFGGATALQMPAGFLRNATFEAPTR